MHDIQLNGHCFYLTFTIQFLAQNFKCSCNKICVARSIIQLKSKCLFMLIN